MYISKIRIENFRLFGAGDNAFAVALKPGLTAFVGENDAGKTAVIDALRFVLGTRDQESMRLDLTDFHHPPSGERADEITIRLTFSGLTEGDRSAFAEYLTYGHGAATETVLILTWHARRAERDGPGRRFMPVEWRTGNKADGPLLDAGARFLLQATYLRPLRDAERAMSAGRGSRLSQILQHTRDIRDHGQKFDSKAEAPLNPAALSVLGLGDYTSHLIENAHGVKAARNRLNQDYLKPLSFSGDALNARVRISGNRDDGARLRHLLEKLEVNLGDADLAEGAHCRGLGSNNILFMACELLLLGAETDGFPLLIIEEPEAHLHPQRQLRLMAFLKAQADTTQPNGQQIQILVTTHSPNLASEIPLDNLVLIRQGRAFALAKDETKLTASDYSFLQRFLDVTKANLFFARGVVIVEGDAENILLPVIASLLGRDFKKYGVSTVNVGGVGLSRYGRIFMRARPEDSEISIPVACITDMDVMPDCAPEILGKIKTDDPIPPLKNSKRRWRVKSDFTGAELDDKRARTRNKANEQRVRTFVADEWTLEYDLAYFGLAKQMQVAIALADNDEQLNAQKTTKAKVESDASAAYETLIKSGLSREALCSTIYEPLAVSNPVSKPMTAQYLALVLGKDLTDRVFTSETLRAVLPAYVVEAIAHVTEPFPEPDEVQSADATEPETAAEDPVYDENRFV